MSRLIRVPMAIILLVIGCFYLSLARGTDAQAAKRPRCLGREATILGREQYGVLRGTPRNDVIVASATDSIVRALGGDDLVCVSGSGITVFGGGGRDRVLGSEYSDQLWGSQGKDRVNGAGGDDDLMGGAGHDTVIGGLGLDRLVARCVTCRERLRVDLTAGLQKEPEGTTDVLSSIESVLAAGAVSVTGDGSPNTFYVGPGSVDIDGAGGDDIIYATNDGGTCPGGPDNADVPFPRTDLIEGGVGRDTMSFEMWCGHVNADLLNGSIQYFDAYRGSGSMSGIEDLIGSEGADSLVGDAEQNSINGGRGGDSISGGPGIDHLVGGDGPLAYPSSIDLAYDLLDYSDELGPVTVEFGEAIHAVTIDGEEETVGFENVIGSDFDDLIQEAPSTVKAGPGDDMVSGDDSWNVIDGGSGTDDLRGKGGPDHLDGGPDADLLNGGDHVDTLRGGAEEDSLKGEGGNDVLYGDALLDGELASAPSSDVLDGGEGSDTIGFSGSVASGPVFVDLAEGTSEGEGSDLLMSIENVRSSRADGNITGDAGANSLSGGEGTVLKGGAGDDRIDSGRYSNLIDAGAGDDRVTFGGGDDVRAGPGEDVLIPWLGFIQHELCDDTGGEPDCFERGPYYTCDYDLSSDQVDGGEDEDTADLRPQKIQGAIWPTTCGYRPPDSETGSNGDTYRNIEVFLYE